MDKPLSWNEIRTRLDEFVYDFADATKENAEAQSFWRELLGCYGVGTKRRGLFERSAKRASTGGAGRIDVFWPGVFIAEHKSAGQLEKAEGQADDYLLGGDVKPSEQPRYIITCDFVQMRVTDLEVEGGPETVTFPVAELPARAEALGFLGGYTARKFSTKAEAAASVEAAKLMARLYAALSGDADTEPNDEDTANVSVLLTRLLFLMFGDDAGLWDRDLFHDFIDARTSEDGRDVGGQLLALFDILNTREDRRPKKADESLLAFPYVNGALFEGRAAMPYFDREMREALLESCRFDWTMISPAVFGSLFQAIKSKQARREGGEHYTTEANILKTIEPLFLDELRARVKAAWNQPKRLRQIHAEMGEMRYLDPACGCGNFLVVAYREMRRLELDLLVRLRELDGSMDARTLDGTWDLKVSLDQFHGIEINWWPAKIAETAMFLVDHQANREMALALGQAPNRLPIKIAAHIHHANALTTDWRSVLVPTDATRVFGNPPFMGDHTRTAEQLAQLQAVWGGDKTLSRMDFVTAWHAQTLRYLSGLAAQWAFVTTNSVTQGDQAARLFGPIFDAGWRIKFAHRTFAWTSEATGKAAVHCVIIGFTRSSPLEPRLFEYPTVTSEPHELKAKNVNAYLIDGPNVLIGKRSVPLSPSLPEVVKGSMATDGGNLVVEQADYATVNTDPIAAKYLRPYIGSTELINGRERWCLWLVDLDPSDLAASPLLRDRIAAVRRMRESSTAATTRDYPHHHLFRQFGITPTTTFVGIPEVSSVNRRYLPVALLEGGTIISNKVYGAVDDGILFGIASSSMFVTWLKTVGGRMKSDLSFSSTIVWNNLPLPRVDDRARAKIVKAGQGVLDARNLHPDRSLAEHYNPLAMDPALVAAHNALDAVVDRAFGAKRTCTSERERQEIMFARYQEMTGALPT